jgi:hypothetical protein
MAHKLVELATTVGLAWVLMLAAFAYAVYRAAR